MNNLLKIAICIAFAFSFITSLAQSKESDTYYIKPAVPMTLAYIDGDGSYKHLSKSDLDEDGRFELQERYDYTYMFCEIATDNIEEHLAEIKRLNITNLLMGISSLRPEDRSVKDNKLEIFFRAGLFDNIEILEIHSSYLGGALPPIFVQPL